MQARRQIKGVDVIGTADESIAAPEITRADLCLHTRLHATQPGSGLDIDRTAQPAVAQQHRSRPRLQADPCHAESRDQGRIELPVICGIEWNAIDQQLELTRAQAAHVQPGGAVTPVPDIDRRQLGQCLIERTRTSAFKVLGRQRVVRPHFVDGWRVVADQHAAQAVSLDLGLAVIGVGVADQAGDSHGGYRHHPAHFVEYVHI